MGNAIVARLGIDGRGVNTGLHLAQKEIDAFRNRNANAGGGHGGGASSATRAAGDVIDLAKGSKGAVMELGALEHALGFSLGAGVGVIGAVAATEKLHESLKSLKEANDEAAASFRQSNAAIVGNGVPALTAKLAEIEGLVEKLKATRGMASSLASMFGGKGQSDSFREQFKLESQRTDLLTKSGAKIRSETEDRLRAVQAGERETELQKVRAETTKKIAEINGDKKLDGTGLRKGMIDSANADAGIAEQGINDKFDAKERELSLERQISALRIAYQNPEKLIAQARIDAANAELEAARSPEAKDQANTRLAAAQAELKLAQKAEGTKRKDERIAADKKADTEENEQLAKSLKRTAKDKEEARMDRIKNERADDDRDNAVQRESAKMVKSIQERSKLTVGEIAKGHGKDANAARRALKLEEQARRHALHGHARPDLIKRADDIRNGIGTVKDSDKTNTAWVAAMNQVQVFNDIKDNTGRFVIQMQ